MNKHSEIKSTIQYLSKCYKADSTSRLSSIFASSIEYIKLLKDSELITGELDHALVEKDYAQEVRNTLQLFVKEKEYKGFFLTIKTKQSQLGRSRFVYTPLYVFNASLVAMDEFDFATIDKESIEVNPAAISILNDSQNIEKEEIYNALTDISPDGNFDMASIIQLQKLLNKNHVSLDTKALDKYPNLLNVAQTKRQKIGEGHSSKIIPNAGFFVKTRSKNSQGILKELELLQKEETYNNTIANYLTGDTNQGETSNILQDITVPTLLSEAQTKALQNTSRYSQMMIIGPPGTGKSYTIAALAINEMNKGNSVLIVSSNPKAVAVIDDKITNTFGIKNVTTQISNTRKFKSSLIKNLTKWINTRSFRKEYGLIAEAIELRTAVAQKRIHKIQKELSRLEELEMKLGLLNVQTDLNLIGRFKKYWTRRTIKNLENHGNLYTEYLRTIKLVLANKKAIIEARHKARLKHALSQNRKLFQDFRLGLKAKISGVKQMHFDTVDFKKLTDVFPIWLSPINEVHNALPYTKELFDIVIFDEASQTDMASVLPILFRARKVVVVGDPKQLRHISFLSKSKQHSIAKEINSSNNLANLFDYRKTSFLDQFNQNLSSQEQVSFLDEHYRSLPDIINHSNHFFYDGALRIMTDTPANREIRGQKIIALKGERNEKGENYLEALFVVSKCFEIIESQRDLPVELRSSIGILSPFRSQIDFINKQLTSAIDTKDLNTHNVILGTAHAFQGDERDIMFISMTVDDNSHHGSFIHLNKDDIFNVSITRARTKQFIIHSIQYLNNLKPESNLKELLTAVFEPSNSDKQEMEMLHITPYLEDILEWLIASVGFAAVRPATEIAGVALDIMATSKNGNIIGIDLVGIPTPMGLQFSFDKVRILNHLKIPVFPIALSDFIYNKESLTFALKMFSDNNDLKM